jgi:hypothetical protein
LPKIMNPNGNPRCQPFEHLRTVSGLSSVKLTSKHQITVPLPVRQALHLSAGDYLAFAQALESNLQEWSSSADDEAFKDL